MSEVLASQEQALVELTRWLGRALQYSVDHPASIELGVATHRAFTTALLHRSPLEVGVLKDDMLLCETRARHPVLRSRTGPYLHERGVLLLRFFADLRVEELSILVELLTISPEQLFARGGLRRLLTERGAARIQVEEITNDLSADERAVERRERRVRGAFQDILSRVLARRGVDGATSAALTELLAVPKASARMLEEGEDIAEAAAGLCLIALQKEARGEEGAREGMKALLLELAPEARARVFLGWPSLAGDFREALGTILDGMNEDGLASFALPAIYMQPSELGRVFYVLEGVCAQSARRHATLRRVAARIHDVPLDDPMNVETLSTLSRVSANDDGYPEERQLVAAAAERASVAGMVLGHPGEASAPQVDSFAPGALDRLSHREAMEIVALGARMLDFEQFCAELPRAAEYLASASGTSAISGMFRALREVTVPRWRDAIDGALRGLANSKAVVELVRDVERSAASLEGERLEETVDVLKTLARERPEPLLDLLARTESRKVRRILLDLLPDAGKSLLPLVRARLSSPEWYVVRNMVTLVRRTGGGSGDLRFVAAHDHPQVRQEVVRALRGLDDEGALDLLVRFLSDEVADVRSAALGTLAEVQLGPSAIHAIADVAGDGERDDDTRRRAIGILGRSKDDAAADALLRLLEPRGLIEFPSATALRDQVALALRRSPAPGAHACFRRGLQSSAWRVRKACERAMSDGGPEA